MSDAWMIGGASAGAVVPPVEEEDLAGAGRRSTRAETASGRGRNEMTGEMDAGETEAGMPIVMSTGMTAAAEETTAGEVGEAEISAPNGAGTTTAARLTRTSTCRF